MGRFPLPVIASSRVWRGLQERSCGYGESYAVFIGDARENLKHLPSECVNTCLTSPPYWSARDYEHKLQIGLEDTVDEYVGNLVAVFREVKRVLKNDGTAWLNLGDCYCHNSSVTCGKNGRPRWMKNKQLSLVPFRVAMALQEDGWWVRNVLAWHKPNAMPASVSDRLANSWEPVFLLAKSEQYFFNLDAIRVPHKTDADVERRRAENGTVNGKAKGKQHLRTWLNSPRHRATIEGLKQVRRRPKAPDPTQLAAYMRHAAAVKGLDIHWIARQLRQPYERVRHYFRTDRIGARLPPERTWETLKELLDLGTKFDDAMAVTVGDNVFRNHPRGRNPGDFASFSIKGNCDEHFATMPLSLASWLLNATLPASGVCLDPFMGIGTTGLATLLSGGRFVGIDIRGDFVKAFRQSLSHQISDSTASSQRPMKVNLSSVSWPVAGSTSLQIGSL